MYKMAVVMRTDIEMGRGKMCAQASHAVLDTYLEAVRIRPDYAVGWLAEGEKVVVLKVNSKQDLMDLYNNVRKYLPAKLVVDAGRTQIERGTITCFGAGPAPEPEIDKFFSKLKLL